MKETLVVIGVGQLWGQHVQSLMERYSVYMIC